MLRQALKSGCRSPVDWEFVRRIDADHIQLHSCVGVGLGPALSSEALRASSPTAGRRRQGACLTKELL
jgi:hypothetical protein